jgi:hypothetical protein
LQVPISYLQKVAPAPQLVYVVSTSSPVFACCFAGVAVDTSTGAATILEEPEEVEPLCGTGTFANPDAKPGNLCVFAEVESGIRPAFKSIVALGESPLWISPAPEHGAVVPFTLKEDVVGSFPDIESPGGFANGSWALSK